MQATAALPPAAPRVHRRRWLVGLGVLAPPMASSNSVTLFTSVVLGIVVYGETLSKSGTAPVAFAFVGFLVAAPRPEEER